MSFLQCCMLIAYCFGLPRLTLPSPDNRTPTPSMDPALVEVANLISCLLCARDERLSYTRALKCSFHKFWIVGRVTQGFLMSLPICFPTWIPRIALAPRLSSSMSSIFPWILWPITSSDQFFLCFELARLFLLLKAWNPNFYTNECTRCHPGPSMQ